MTSSSLLKAVNERRTCKWPGGCKFAAPFGSLCGYHQGREMAEAREGAKKKPPRGLA